MRSKVTMSLALMVLGVTSVSSANMLIVDRFTFARPPAPESTVDPKNNRMSVDIDRWSSDADRDRRVDCGVGHSPSVRHPFAHPQGRGRRQDVKRDGDDHRHQREIRDPAPKWLPVRGRGLFHFTPLSGERWAKPAPPSSPSLKPLWTCASLVAA